MADIEGKRRALIRSGRRRYDRDAHDQQADGEHQRQARRFSVI